MTVAALSTLGIGAQGDFTGVGGAGGFATRVGFSAAPLRISPFPEPSTLGLTEGETLGTAAVAGKGAGDCGFSNPPVSFAGGCCGRLGACGVACSSTWGRAILVPSFQEIVSGAQSSSSSSMSAQFDWPLPSSGCRRVAMWIPYFFSSSSVNFLGSGGGTATSLSVGSNEEQDAPRRDGPEEICSRLFLFHTALGSGAGADFPPFALAEVFAIKPLPDLATSRGRGVAVDAVPCAATRPAPVAGLSLGFEGPVAGAPLDARKVLFTDTDLKDVGFLTVEEVRAWPFSSSLSLDRDASVSDPPLMLTSAEFTRSSTISEICLFPISSVGVLPASLFSCGWLELTS